MGLEGSHQARGRRRREKSRQRELRDCKTYGELDQFVTSPATSPVLKMERELSHICIPYKTG
jgi:hypothetical protein